GERDDALARGPVGSGQAADVGDRLVAAVVADGEQAGPARDISGVVAGGHWLGPSRANMGREPRATWPGRFLAALRVTCRPSGAVRSPARVAAACGALGGRHRIPGRRSR